MTKSFTFALLVGVASLPAIASAQTVAAPTVPAVQGGVAVAAPMPATVVDPVLAPVPGPVVQGPLAGTAIGGVSNAVWADQNNDGVVDGYVQNGQYYSGAPEAVPVGAPATADMPPPPPARGERG